MSRIMLIRSAITSYFTLVLILCIILFFFLPADVQESLKARSDRLNPLSLFMSTFIHADLKHLLSNISAFILSGLLIFAIAYISNHEKNLLFSLLLTTFISPFISNALSILLLTSPFNNRPFCGLSAVISGIIGLIIPYSGIIIEELLQGKNIAKHFFALSLSLAFSMITFILKYLILFVMTSILSVIVFITGPLRFLYNSKKITGFRKQNSSVKSKMIIALIGLLFFYFSLVHLFPSNMVTLEGNIVNIFAHYIGLFCGILIGYLAICIR